MFSLLSIASGSVEVSRAFALAPGNAVQVEATLLAFTASASMTLVLQGANEIGGVWTDVQSLNINQLGLNVFNAVTGLAFSALRFVVAGPASGTNILGPVNAGISRQ